jgi:hypothetical protein
VESFGHVPDRAATGPDVLDELRQPVGELCALASQRYHEDGDQADDEGERQQVNDQRGHPALDPSDPLLQPGDRRM